jgi:hypothetical protein
MTTINESLEKLRSTGRGQAVLRDLEPFLRGKASGLDQYGQKAVIGLIVGFFDRPWAVRDWLPAPEDVR